MAEVGAMSLGFRFSRSQDYVYVLNQKNHQINSWCFSVCFWWYVFFLIWQLMAVGVTVFWRKWKATDTMRGWNGIPKFQTSKPRKFKEKNQWGSGSVVDVVYLLIYGWYGWVFGCHGAYGNKTSTIYVYIYICLVSNRGPFGIRLCDLFMSQWTGFRFWEIQFLGHFGEAADISFISLPYTSRKKDTLMKHESSRIYPPNV